MIKAIIVRQISDYKPVAYELQETLEAVQTQGHKVVNVIETKLNKMPRHTDQGFIILYDTGEEEGEDKQCITEN